MFVETKSKLSCAIPSHACIKGQMNLVHVYVGPACKSRHLHGHSTNESDVQWLNAFVVANVQLSTMKTDKGIEVYYRNSRTMSRDRNVR